MKIKYYGHSFFKISSQDYEIAIDPYKPSMIPGMEELKIEANEVLCSHNHEDHCYKDIVHVENKKSPFTLYTIESYHDDTLGSKRGNNKIHVLEAEGIRLAHFGDLGHILSNEQIEALGKLDVVLMPMGGFYTIDKEEAMENIRLLQPRIIIPMHYRTSTYGFREIDDIETIKDFLKTYQEVGDEIEISSEMNGMIIMKK